MQFRNLIRRNILVTLALVCMMGVIMHPAYAEDTSTQIAGTVYELGKADHYEWEGASGNATTQDNTIGSLKILGDIQGNGKEDEITAYVVNTGALGIDYALNDMVRQRSEDEWHLTEHKTKEVNGMTLDNNIASGAIIVQSSLDRTYWSTEVIVTDAFADGAQTDKPLCQSKDIQLQNGCFYRITVAYKLQRKLEDKKVLFVSMDNYEEKELAEVYEFYALSGESLGQTATPKDAPRKELGKKVNTGKDNGFSGEVAIDKDDPHYGWELGAFVINGYTSEMEQDGTPVFLKNVGDKVTLWFTLEQDITCLNGDEALSIAEDTNGYDLKFEVEQTNFKHGALIIRYTDYEGHPGEPVIYTDFLAANALTGADTRVQLFEEGDYEVVLDYEIRNDPRKIGPVSVVPTYTDYQISFQFSIRNSNSMVFPFDLKTGAELANQAVAENGFRLDMAKSRYLKIDVERAVLKTNDDGSLIKDIRFHRTAKESDTYTEDGIYTFTVTNAYTGTTTTKTIYVGSDKYMLALANYGLTVDALNEKLAQGAVIEEDGTLTDPPPAAEVMAESTVAPTVEATSKPTSIPTNSAMATTLPTIQPVNEPDSTGTALLETEKLSLDILFPVLFVAIGVLALGCILVALKKRSKKKRAEEESER